MHAKSAQERQIISPIGTVKTITLNFQHLAIASAYNQLLVLDAAQSLSTVDTLEGHREEIIAFDVSQVQKIVASISRRHLVIHCLVDSEPGQNFLRDRVQTKVSEGEKLEREDIVNLLQNRVSANTGTKLRLDPLQDYAVYTGTIKWIMTYRVELSHEMAVTTMAMSQMGDFLVIAGDRNLALWGQESQLDSYMQQILYTQEEMPNQFASVKEVLETLTGEIVQVDICGAGRVIVSLERGSHTLKVWHQEFPEVKSDKEEIKSRRLQFNPLAAYELPRSKSRQNALTALDRFKIMHKDFNTPWLQPTVIVTIQQHNQEAAIWVESLTEQSMSFSCVSVVTTKSMGQLGALRPNFDAIFIQSTQYHPRQHTERVERWNCSPLLEPSRDKELTFKKVYQPKNEQLGMVPAKLKSRAHLSLNPNTTLVDWLAVLNGNNLLLYKCTGLRNFPQCACSVTMATIVQIPGTVASLFAPVNLHRAYCKTLDDQVSLICSNKRGQIVKLWFQAQEGIQSAVKVEASNMLVGSRSKIKDVLCHPQFPVVALIYDSREVMFYLLSETTHPLHGKPEMIFLGNYQSTKDITSAKWIPGTLQMAVLTDGKTLAVISQPQISKLAGLCSQVEQLQHELLKRFNLMSPTGQVHSTEPQPFQEVAQITLELQKVCDIFAVSHRHEGTTQTLSFAAITENGAQHVSSLAWDGSRQVQPTLKTISKRHSFNDGFQLHRVLATNEDFSSPSTFALLALKKEQEQQVATNQRRGPEKKPLCKLMLVEYTTDSITESFSIDLTAEEMLERPVLAKFGEKLLGVVISQGDFHTEAKHLYLYDLATKSYRGFLDLSAVVYGSTKHVTLDLFFLEENHRAAVVLFCENDVYVINESDRKWKVERSVKGFFGFEPLTIKSLLVKQVRSQLKNCLVCVTNQDHVFMINDGEIVERSESKVSEELRIGNFRTKCLHNSFIQSQKSMPLFYPSLLKSLYIKGYANLVVKILVQMHEALKRHKDDSQLVSDYIDMDLQALLLELQQQADAYVLASGGGQVQAAKQGKKQAAYSAFDAFDESSQSEEEIGGKGEDAEKKDFTKEFKDSSEEFIQILQSRAVVTFGLSKADVLELIAFVLRFKTIFEKDFYADSLASMLLRKIFVESEKVDPHVLERAEKEIDYTLGGHDDQHLEEPEETKDTKEFKGFSMEEFMAQKLGGMTQSAGELALCSDWTSEMVAMALHSDNQDVILDTLSDRFNFNDNLNWSLMRRLSIPLWLKNITRLKQLIELVVKNEYRVATGSEGKPRAESAALWYILLGKNAILQKLYKVEPGQEKFAEFFSKNFDDPKVRTIAGKNAMALVPKKKFHLACGFFLLADDLQGAIQIALDRTKDSTLAVLLCKIYDPQNEKKAIDTVLNAEFIKRGETMNDPYLINIGMWLKKEFLKAVNSLSPTTEDDCLKYIFKPNALEFNLCPHLERPPAEQDISKAPKGQNFANIEQEADVISYPLISQKSYIILDLVKKLQKAPDVKRMLNKDWTLDKKKGQKSIFDDFLGSGSESAEEEQPKETITVDEAQVLSFAVEKAMQQKQTLLGLLLIEEQAALRPKMNDQQKIRLAKTLLLDYIVGYIAQKSKRSQSGHVQELLKNLATSLGIQTEAVQAFLLSTCRQLGQVRLEIELLVEIDQQGQDQSLRDLTRIFEETQRLQGFVTTCNRFGGFLMESQEVDICNNERMLGLVQHLERLIDCHMLQSSKAQVPTRHETKKIEENEGEEDDMDFDEKPQKTLNHLHSNMFVKSSEVSVKGLQPSDTNKRSGDTDYLADKTRRQHEVQLRFQSMLMILMSTFHVSLICNKLSMAKELLIQSQILMGVCLHFGQQLSDGTIHLDQFEQINSLFKYQAVKTLLNKLEGTLLRNQDWGVAAMKLVKDHASLGDVVGELHHRKIGRDIDKDRDPTELQFISAWLRTCCVMQLAKTCRESHLSEQSFYNYQLQRTELLISETAAKTPPKSLPMSFEFKGASVSLVDVLTAIFVNETGFSLRKMTEMLDDQSTSMESVCSHLFEKILSLRAQFGLSSDFDAFTRNRFVSQAGKVFVGAYFFPNEVKFRDFCTTMELSTCMAALQEHHYSLLKTKAGGNPEHDFLLDNNNPYQANRDTDSPMKGDRQRNAESATFRNKTSLLSNEQGASSRADYINQKLNGGVEVFKQLRETVSDFCFDSCNPDNLAFAMQARGMREISIHKTLLYRNRIATGFEFIDEELYSWSDMLHRYDQIAIVHQKLKPKSDSVKAAVMGLYQQPSTFGTLKLTKRRKQFLLDEVLNPPEVFGDDLSVQYLNAYSNLDVTHEDYSNAIESHPKLPLYVTGNSKGLLCLWNFGQVTDRSLNQWILDPETPPAQANPKKATIRKIAFSDGGDKIAAANMDGCLYLMGFDLREQSKQSSLYDTQFLNRSKELRINDFQFLDGDSLIACCSFKEKSVQILDTMMPPKHSVVLQLKSGNGGNLLTVNSNKQKLYCFNQKPGVMCEYDLRMLKDAVNSVTLSKEEITAVASDPITDALIVGFNDGVVKIYDEEKPAVQMGQRRAENVQSTYNARETINAFTNIDGKKKPVSQIKVHPDNGSLFASSTAGVIKLLRLQA